MESFKFSEEGWKDKNDIFFRGRIQIVEKGLPKY